MPIPGFHLAVEDTLDRPKMEQEGARLKVRKVKTLLEEAPVMRK